MRFLFPHVQIRNGVAGCHAVSGARLTSGQCPVEPVSHLFGHRHVFHLFHANGRAHIGRTASGEGEAADTNIISWRSFHVKCIKPWFRF